MAADPYSTNVWRTLRRRVLVRDGQLCQLRLPGCTVTATEVHHLDPPSEGGAQYPPADRLQASCKHCNVAEKNARVAANSRAHQAAAGRLMPAPAAGGSSVRQPGIVTDRPWCESHPRGERCPNCYRDPRERRTNIHVGVA